MCYKRTQPNFKSQINLFRNRKTMSFCAHCSTSIDESNESQPVCPCCGEAEFSGDSSHNDPDSFESPLFMSTSADQSSETTQDLEAIRNEYKKEPRGIRYRTELRGVCLQCGASATGNSFLVCSNPQCGESWRVNHCHLCKETVDSRDPATPRCPRCGWLTCAACSACNCVH